MTTIKYKTGLFIILLWLSALAVHAQNNKASKLNLFGRLQGNNAELRYFPADKLSLAQGLISGYSIERANNNSGFVEIAQTQPLSIEEWDKLIAAENNPEAQEELRMAKALVEKFTRDLPANISQANWNKLLEENKKQNFAGVSLIIFALKNQDVINALGWQFIDKGVNPAQKYRYRIKIKGQQISSEPIEVSQSNQNDSFKQKMKIKKGDTQLGFQWQIDKRIYGYDMEKSVAGTGNFTRLNKAPIIKIKKPEEASDKLGFLVNNLKNYQKYTFRLYGYNVFGERKLIDEQTAFSVDLTPPPAPLVKTPVQKGNGIIIEWKMSDEPGDLKGFVVSRGTQHKGVFKVLNKGIIDKNIRSFVDKDFKADVANFYVVSALDSVGNMRSSNPVLAIVFDTIAPKKPLIQSVDIDTTGVVKIVVKLNPEKDLMGYKLYRANHLKDEFTPVKDFFREDKTKPVQNVFLDTIVLKTLAKNVYYKVKALDFHYNKSEFSDVFTVDRPDIVPPSAPVFKNVKSFEDRIELRFVLSPSNDVKEQYLYRKLPEDKKWTQLAVLSNNQNLYVDKDVQPGKTYYYSLRAVDKSGLYSEYALVVSASAVPNGKIPEVQNLSVKQNGKYVKLSWNYKNNGKNINFVVFKQVNGGKLKKLKTTSRHYIEDGLSAKGVYKYAVKVYDKTGKESKLSDFVEVKL